MEPNNGGESDPVWRHEPVLSKVEFWSKAAAWSFGLWSLVVLLAANWIAGAVVRSIEANERFRAEFADYVKITERRLILVEERQAVVLKWIASEELERRLDKDKPK